MENTNKSNLKKYAIGILIAIGFYLVSMFVGSIFNVLISFAAGYRKYSDFTNSDNIAGFLAIIIVGLANHIFTGWLTVNTMAKYGRKQNCITKWFFRSAAIGVVVLAVVVIPILFSNNPGWLIYVSHSLSILLFGRRKVKKYNDEQAAVATSNRENGNNNFSTAGPVVQVRVQPTMPEQGTFIYCHKCGTKLNANTQFCHKCGTKVAR
ncbi:MAG TPA: zinc ribbon domain-containing protein [Lachnospiraceae bacterium]|nr:zinc ribbon domain-containing protein [Lachnospiraceae bacterium]